jgi:hypothetical protein
MDCLFCQMMCNIMLTSTFEAEREEAAKRLRQHVKTEHIEMVTNVKEHDGAGL